MRISTHSLKIQHKSYKCQARTVEYIIVASQIEQAAFYTFTTIALSFKRKIHT